MTVEQVLVHAAHARGAAWPHVELFTQFPGAAFAKSVFRLVRSTKVYDRRIFHWFMIGLSQPLFAYLVLHLAHGDSCRANEYRIVLVMSEIAQLRISDEREREREREKLFLR